MVENTEKTNTPIKKLEPSGDVHPGVVRTVLDDEIAIAGPRRQMLGLADFIKNTIINDPSIQPGAVRAKHNPHLERFVVERKGEIFTMTLSELQAELAAAGVQTQVLGVQEWGNEFQKVTATVQGVDPNNPSSGFERPTVAEGPNVVLVPYAFDSKGGLHIFRTLQHRTGEVVVDTIRGFADHSTLVEGKPLDATENAAENVEKNIKRVIGEEAGRSLLQIKEIVYLGYPRSNTTFITSGHGLFGVEVDYEQIMQNNKMLTVDEIQRQGEQFEHEGLIGGVIDMTLEQYVNYIRDSSIPRDLNADSPSNMVVIDFLAKKLQALQDQEKNVNRSNKAWKEAIRNIGDPNIQASVVSGYIAARRSSRQRE